MGPPSGRRALSARPAARLRRTSAAVGGALFLAALVILWQARVSIGRDAYVSELGAPGEPTADRFRIALIFIAVGAVLLAAATGRLRAAWRPLVLASPAIAFCFSAAMFGVAAALPCTPGCPTPLSADSTWRDFVHIVAAVLAFASAGLAMLEYSFAPAGALVRWVSRGSALSVILIASVGGLLSLFRVWTGLGGWLELVATTIALVWAVALGALLAVGRVRPVVLAA